MPFYVSDYEADTTHLTIEEDGAYNRLLRLCWRTPGCSIPNDEAWIMKRVRVDVETFETVVKPVIDEFFRTEKGRVFQVRQMREYKKTQAKARTARENGKKGGRPAKHMKDKENSKPSGLFSLNPEKGYPEPEPKEEKEIVPISKKKQKRGCRIPDDFEPDQKQIQFALSRGMSDDEIDDELQKFKNYWLAKTGANATKLNWQLTFNSWIRNWKGKVNGRLSKNDQMAIELEKIKQEAVIQCGPQLKSH